MLLIFPILIWQKWTKYWTKVVIHGNFVHTKVTYKGITFTALSQITLYARQTGSSGRSY